MAALWSTFLSYYSSKKCKEVSGYLELPYSALITLKNCQHATAEWESLRAVNCLQQYSKVSSQHASFASLPSLVEVKR